MVDDVVDVTVEVGDDEMVGDEVLDDVEGTVVLFTIIVC